MKIQSSSEILFTLIVATYISGLRAIARDFDNEADFDKLARNISVVTGQNAVLPCAVRYKGNHSLIWMNPDGKILSLDDRRIFDDSRFSVERPFKKEWNLHIREVTMRDQGTYRCQINTLPEPKTRHVFLHIFEPPQIIEHMSSPRSVSVLEGETVELICNVTGTPPPTVAWYRTHQGMNEDGEVAKKEQLSKPGEVLVIHNVTRYCVDIYQCVAYNGVEPAASKSIQVNVEFPPEVYLPTKRLRQSRKKDTVLECQITGYPQAVSKWKYKGKDLRSHSDMDMYKEGNHKLTIILKLDNLQEEDFGEYECEASNKLGQDSEVMYLDELYPPTPKPTTTTLAPVQQPWDQVNIGYNEVDRGINRNGYQGSNSQNGMDMESRQSPVSDRNNEYRPYNNWPNPEYSSDPDGEKRNSVISSDSKGDKNGRTRLHKNTSTIVIMSCLSILVIQCLRQRS